MPVRTETSQSGSGRKITIPYVSAKYEYAQHILPELPPHTTYIEVFGSPAPLLFWKPPVPIEVYNDINGDLVNLFRVVRTPDLFRELLDRLRNTTDTQKALSAAIRVISDPDGASPVERAWAYFAIAAQAISGVDTPSKSNENKQSYYYHLRQLVRLRNRMRTVLIEHDDPFRILKRYDRENTLFNLDIVPFFEVNREKVTYYPRINQEKTDMITLRMRNLKSSYVFLNNVNYAQKHESD